MMGTWSADRPVWALHRSILLEGFAEDTLLVGIVHDRMGVASVGSLLLPAIWFESGGLRALGSAVDRWGLVGEGMMGGCVGVTTWSIVYLNPSLRYSARSIFRSLEDRYRRVYYRKPEIFLCFRALTPLLSSHVSHPPFFDDCPQLFDGPVPDRNWRHKVVDYIYLITQSMCSLLSSILSRQTIDVVELAIKSHRFFSVLVLWLGLWRLMKRLAQCLMVVSSSSTILIDVLVQWRERWGFPERAARRSHNQYFRCWEVHSEQQGMNEQTTKRGDLRTENFSVISVYCWWTYLVLFWHDYIYVMEFQNRNEYLQSSYLAQPLNCSLSSLAWFGLTPIAFARKSQFSNLERWSPAANTSPVVDKHCRGVAMHTLPAPSVRRCQNRKLSALASRLWALGCIFKPWTCCWPVGATLTDPQRTEMPHSYRECLFVPVCLPHMYSCSTVWRGRPSHFLYKVRTMWKCIYTGEVWR